jgi:AbrB family looped-hinge helix DNA binding protein
MGIVRKRVKMSERGRIVIPSEFRRCLNLQAGDDLVVLLEGGELRLFSPKEGIRRAQDIVDRYIPDGQSLSDGLIAERRAEATDEWRGAAGPLTSWHVRCPCCEWHFPC